jgi:hypothetical protein
MFPASWSGYTLLKRPLFSRTFGGTPTRAPERFRLPFHSSSSTWWERPCPFPDHQNWSPFSCFCSAFSIAWAASMVSLILAAKHQLRPMSQIKGKEPPNHSALTARLFNYFSWWMSTSILRSQQCLIKHAQTLLRTKDCCTHSLLHVQQDALTQYKDFAWWLDYSLQVFDPTLSVLSSVDSSSDPLRDLTVPTGAEVPSVWTLCYRSTCS